MGMWSCVPVSSNRAAGSGVSSRGRTVDPVMQVLHRQRRGMKQTIPAHLVGRSVRWLVDVELGRIEPRFSDVIALADRLGADLGELLPPRTNSAVNSAP